MLDRFIHYIFDDKRAMCGFLVAWFILVMYMFFHLGIVQTQFIGFGPSENTFYMSIPIHTWFRWYCVAGFTFCSTCINDLASDSLSPWLQNAIQDHKSRHIPYSKLTCWAISMWWSFYCSIMSMFGIFLVLSQVDFLLIRTLADLFVNSFTTNKFLSNKTTNPSEYEMYLHGEEEPLSRKSFSMSEISKDELPHQKSVIQITDDLVSSRP